MRVYLEKPRTTLGWKGIISDPNLDGSFDINSGLKLARKLLLDLASIGLPTATEFLDTIIPQYLSDLISWSAVGARTSESQIHRELASGLRMPVGFKNSTDGNIKIAVDAVSTASYPHHYLSIDKDGTPIIVSTEGNDSCHIILRGGASEANYEKKYIKQSEDFLQQIKLHPTVMIDCSHGNSMKSSKGQPKVLEAIAKQISEGCKTISGVMIESNLVSGNQVLKSGKSLTYGQSITDECLSWVETLPLLDKLALAVNQRRNKKAQI